MGSREIKLVIGIMLLVVGAGITIFQLITVIGFVGPTFPMSPSATLFMLPFLLFGPLLIGGGGLLLFLARKGYRRESEIRENGRDIQGTVVDHITIWYGRNTKRTALVVQGDNGYQYTSEGMLTKPIMAAFPLGSRIIVRIDPHNPQNYWIDLEGQTSIPLK